MENSIVPPRTTSVHHPLVHNLEEPIPSIPRTDLLKTIGLGLTLAVGQYAILIYLIGAAGHR
jgi:hypothetical protein